MRRVFLFGILAVSTLFEIASSAQEPRDPMLDAMTKSATWVSPEFLSRWSESPPGQTRVCRTYRNPPILFGVQPQSIQGWFEDGRLTSITIIYLDSGAWFGYVPDSEARKTAQTKGPEFIALYKKDAASVSAGLEQLSGRKGRDLVIGAGPLKGPVRIFVQGDLASRLTLDQDQLIKLSIFPNEQIASQLFSPELIGMKKDQKMRLFAGQVQVLPDGDHLIDSVPVILQGDRAYCGVSTLGMLMRYLGVNLDTEDYAAAAGIRFGSTVGSHIKETYDAAGEVAAMHLFRATKLEFAKAKASIDAGLPVVVFRHWSQERDYLHAAFARNYASNPALELPKPDLNDQKLWPAHDSFAHASVVNGYNERRREVIFTESWSERARNRRMRIEEMEATCYFAYFPHF